MEGISDESYQADIADWCEVLLTKWNPGLRVSRSDCAKVGQEHSHYLKDCQAYYAALNVRGSIDARTQRLREMKAIFVAIAQHPLALGAEKFSISLTTKREAALDLSVEGHGVVASSTDKKYSGKEPGVYECVGQDAVDFAAFAAAIRQHWKTLDKANGDPVLTAVEPDPAHLNQYLAALDTTKQISQLQMASS